MLCHCCHPRGRPAAISDTPASARLPHVTIDMHCHLLVPAVEALVADHPRKRAEADEQRAALGDASFEHNQGMRAAIADSLVKPAVRLRDMDRLGIDIQVLSPSPTQYYPWADTGLADTIITAQNSAIAQTVAAHPERFIGLGGVALQHPALAARQLRTAMDQYALKGVEISSDPTGRGLDDPALDVFWAEAERLDAVIFLHPLGTSLGSRVDRYYLSNIIGQPLETTIALSQLIYGGVLDRYPGLKICAAHGGGYLPFYAGRSDHGHRVRPEAANCRHAPGWYLRRLWYDTVVYRPDSVAALIAAVGPDRVVAGTDYPFDMGEYALHDLIRQIPGASAEIQAVILGGNATLLLGLPPHHPALVAARQKLDVQERT